MASKKKWKKRALKARSARGVGQALAFETRSNLEGQLRAIDHIILHRELPGPSIEEWVAQAQAVFQELIQCRREKKVDGYSARDIEEMRDAIHIPYQEYFAPIPPRATHEHAESIVRALTQEFRDATGS